MRESAKIRYSQVDRLLTAKWAISIHANDGRSPLHCLGRIIIGLPHALARAGTNAFRFSSPLTELSFCSQDPSTESALSTLFTLLRIPIYRKPL